MRSPFGAALKPLAAVLRKAYPRAAGDVPPGARPRGARPRADGRPTLVIPLAASPEKPALDFVRPAGRLNHK